jgi:hypothetical protein
MTESKESEHRSQGTCEPVVPEQGERHRKSEIWWRCSRNTREHSHKMGTAFWGSDFQNDPPEWKVPHFRARWSVWTVSR